MLDVVSLTKSHKNSKTSSLIFPWEDSGSWSLRVLWSVWLFSDSRWVFSGEGGDAYEDFSRLWDGLTISISSFPIFEDGSTDIQVDYV